MKTINGGFLLSALIVLSPASDTPAKQSVLLSDFVSGRYQIIGSLGVPIGQVVRIDATVVAADKVWPESKTFKGQYLLSIHAIDGREVSNLFVPFHVNRFAVSKLLPSRHAIEERLGQILKRNPADDEVAKTENDMLSAGKRTFLTYEEVFFGGVPADLPTDVFTWSGVSFGPFSKVVVIQELPAKN